MGSFNWQEEEGSWDATQDLTQTGAQADSRPTKRRRRMIGLASVGVIALLALGSWWWVNSVEDDLAADVLKSWGVVVASEQAGDIELLMNQLSGSDEAWVKTQRQLLTEENLTARGAILPSLVISSSETAGLSQPEVVFSPDLLEATLTHEVTYLDRWGREVTLLQEEVFRLGVDRWLFAPPSRQGYWERVVGEEDKLKFSNRFAYSSPPKDSELVDDIMLWFENRLDLICLSDFVYACKSVETAKFEIRFLPILTDDMLEGGFQPHGYEFGANAPIFEFPTPSLIGIPATDKDRQLLVEAYGELYFADYLMSAVMQANSSQGSNDYVEDFCLRAISAHAAQQVDAVAPLRVKDYGRYLEREEVLNQPQSIAVVSETKKSELTLFFQLTVLYHLQESLLSSQQLFELSPDSKSTCSSLNFESAEERDAFNRFVEFRASIQN